MDLIIKNYLSIIATLLALILTTSIIFATPLKPTSEGKGFSQNWPETKNEHKKFKNFIPKPRVKRQYGGNMGPMMGGFGGNSMSNAIASSNSGGFGGMSNAMAMAASSNYGGFGNSGSTAFASANSGGGFGGGSSATAFANANSFKK